MEGPLGFLLDPFSSHSAAHAAAAAVDARRAAARWQRVRARGVVFLTDAPISEQWLDGRAERFEQPAAPAAPAVRAAASRGGAARHEDDAGGEGTPSSSVLMDTVSSERKRKPPLTPDSLTQSVHFTNRRDDILNSVFYEVKQLGLQGGGRLPVLPSLHRSSSKPELATQGVLGSLGRNERERVAAAILAMGMGRNEAIEVADGAGGTRRVRLSCSLPSLGKLASVVGCGEGRPGTGEAREVGGGGSNSSSAAVKWQAIINEADGPAGAGEPEDGLLDGPVSPGLAEWDLSIDQLQPEPPPASGNNGRKGKGGKSKNKKRRGESSGIVESSNRNDINIGSSSIFGSNNDRSRSRGEGDLSLSSASRGAGAGDQHEPQQHELQQQKHELLQQKHELQQHREAENVGSGAGTRADAPAPHDGAEPGAAASLEPPRRLGGDVNEKARYLAEHSAKRRERAQLERVIRKHANEQTLEARLVRASCARAEREHRWEQRRAIHQAHQAVQGQARDVVVRRVHETRDEGRRQREAEKQRARDRVAACRAREAAGVARTLALLPRAELLADGACGPAGLKPAFPGTALRRSTLGGGFQPSSIDVGKGWRAKNDKPEAAESRLDASRVVSSS
jgi:hypothetical protein